MKKDFTTAIYKELIQTFISNDYQLITVKDYFEKNHLDKIVILRHDIDLLPKNALIMAKIENYFGITGSYYFRSIPESWDKNIVKKIMQMGHEIGYHYETMDQANGNIDEAWNLFRMYLDKMRKITEINTICMHGSPKSNFDNKEIWKKYDYKSLEILGEAYYDINFDKIFYLTDTGRRWDGWKVSIRDKVPQQNDWLIEGLVYNSTHDIIKAIKENQLPNQIVLNAHPQRWYDKTYPWLKELIFQNIKNLIKRLLIYTKQ